jgi:hypothetical protein
MIYVSYDKIKRWNVKEKQDNKYIEVPNHNKLLIVFFYNRKTANYPLIYIEKKLDHSDNTI